MTGLLAVLRGGEVWKGPPSLSSCPRLHTCYSICSANAWMRAVVPTLVTRGRSLRLLRLRAPACDGPAPGNTLPPRCSVVRGANALLLADVSVWSEECPNGGMFPKKQNSPLLFWWHGDTVVADVSPAAMRLVHTWRHTYVHVHLPQ